MPVDKIERHPKDGLPILAFTAAAGFRNWLSAGQEATGMWLKLGRKGSGHESVTYAEALDAALCFGWIDGQAGKLDADWTLRRFTPRTRRSKWSQINCKRVEELSREGLMEPRGLQEVEAAKADGRWAAAYASSRNIGVPEDLAAALREAPVAAEFFAGISAQNRYAILYRIQDAKKPETRLRRIVKFVAMLAEGKTLH
ncbi:MAG: hypothetical protein JWO82_1384 [Akkermansiaceae bacterium]|nr:hypothetical protein [Akkermansiaceae bacterium]